MLSLMIYIFVNILHDRDKYHLLTYLNNTYELSNDEKSFCV